MSSSESSHNLALARSSLRRWLSTASSANPDRIAVERALEELDAIDRPKTVSIAGIEIEI